MLGQPPKEDIFGFCANFLEQKLDERASRMSDETPTTSRQQLLEPQNSFERNVAEITRQSMQSFDEDSPAPKRKTMLRREGTFSIYDSGKNANYQTLKFLDGFTV